jgi:hypothetical protein
MEEKDNLQRIREIQPQFIAWYESLSEDQVGDILCSYNLEKLFEAFQDEAGFVGTWVLLGYWIRLQEDLPWENA